ncbi:MAG TPA: hypothetical protein VFE47_04910 [Tepidisphaeraceae bacterium]|jgi:hypothetical protein|nr:hypothetical protein [Tepidisphaeraceae bacterium]
MLAPRMIVCLVLGGVLVVGCKKQDKTPSEPPVQPAPATPVVPTPPVNPKPLHTQTPTLAPGHNPTALPSLPEPAAATEPSSDAKALLAEVSQDVAAKKWDAAADNLKKLNAMKGHLSPDMKSQIATAEDKFVAAKAGAGLNLPGIGGPTTAPAPVEPNK